MLPPLASTKCKPLKAMIVVRSCGAMLSETRSILELLPGDYLYVGPLTLAERGSEIVVGTVMDIATSSFPHPHLTFLGAYIKVRSPDPLQVSPNLCCSFLVVTSLTLRRISSSYSTPFCSNRNASSQHHLHAPAHLLSFRFSYWS